MEIVLIHSAVTPVGHSLGTAGLVHVLAYTGLRYDCYYKMKYSHMTGFTVPCPSQD